MEESDNMYLRLRSKRVDRNRVGTMEESDNTYLRLSSKRVEKNTTYLDAVRRRWPKDDSQHPMDSEPNVDSDLHVVRGSSLPRGIDKTKPDKKPHRYLTRKRPAGISNIPQRPNSSAQNDIEQLKKENMALVRLMADKEQNLQKVQLENMQLKRSNSQMLAENTAMVRHMTERMADKEQKLQKVQLQNRQLAQSNSQMLAGQNSSKDKLKALSHELGCKNGLVQALKSELQAKVKTTARRKIVNEVEVTKPVEREQQPPEADT